MVFWRKLATASSLAALLLGLPIQSTPVLAAGKHQGNAASSAAAPSQPGAIGGIAAVVNQDAITDTDVEARLRLAMLGTGLPDNAEVREKLRPQVLRQLVDERLQIQEAKRFGISVSKAEIDAGMERIAQQNHTSRTALIATLASRRVPASTMESQVEAAMSWQRVLQRKIRQEVVIGGEEVDAALERMKADIGKSEYLVAEIFLAVDKPSQDAEVGKLAQRLYDELRRGANFVAVARQFSQSAGAANGGDIGWVRQGDLRNELDSSLKSLRPGQLSAPIRSADGYHLLLMRAQRAVGSKTVVAAPPPRPQQQAKPNLAKATVNMHQIVFPAGANTDEARKAAVEKAEAARKSIRSCGQFDAYAKASGVAESGDMGTLKVKDLPKGLQGLAVNIPLGTPSPVLQGPGGALLLIVCSRNMPMIEPPAQPEPPQPSLAASAKDARVPLREEVEADLIAQRSETLSRRYLRDLRRSAYIDYR